MHAEKGIYDEKFYFKFIVYFFKNSTPPSPLFCRDNKI